MTTMSAMTTDAVPELTLGWRLQMAMRHAGLTALEMSQEMEVGRDTVARWLHDETVPHRLFLQAWAERCQVNYDWLAGIPAPKVARGTGERAGRDTVTDNKKSTERGRRPARKKAETHSYREYCLGKQRMNRRLARENMQIALDEGEMSLLDHSPWVASSERSEG